MPSSFHNVRTFFGPIPFTPSKSITPFGVCCNISSISWKIPTQQITDFCLNTFPTLRYLDFLNTHFSSEQDDVPVWTRHSEWTSLNGFSSWSSINWAVSLNCFRDFFVWHQVKNIRFKKFYFHWRFIQSQFPQAFSQEHHSASRHFDVFKIIVLFAKFLLQYSGSGFRIKVFHNFFKEFFLFR